MQVFVFKTYTLQIYVMIDHISKFMKNEMFESNNAKKRPGLNRPLD